MTAAPVSHETRTGLPLGTSAHWVDTCGDMNVAPSASMVSHTFCEDSGFPPPGNTIRVGILESDPVIRDSLGALVHRSPGLQCVARLASVGEAMRAIPNLKPGVLLVDARLLSLHGADLIAKFKTGSPGTHFLILTTFEPGELIFDAVRAGASGDLPKTTPAAELVRAVQWAHAGGSPISMPMARRLVAHFQGKQTPGKSAGSLTFQERRILDALARGVSYRTVADESGLGVSTVLSHLRGVCAKLAPPAYVT